MHRQIVVPSAADDLGNRPGLVSEPFQLGKGMPDIDNFTRMRGTVFLIKLLPVALNSHRCGPKSASLPVKHSEYSRGKNISAAFASEMWPSQGHRELIEYLF